MDHAQHNHEMEGAGSLDWSFSSFVGEQPNVEKIETHPHGAFLLLWRSLGQEGKPPEKNKSAGQDARFAILKKFVPTLTREMVPDHDAMDAAVASLVAALHRLGLTRS